MLTAKILIIDDDDVFRGMLQEMLTRAGYKVVAADNGKSGVALYRKDPADLVITDILMPQQEGMATILELHEDYPEVKIIVISGGGGGNAENYLKAATLLSCVKASLCKPFTKAEMLKTVKEVLK